MCYIIHFSKASLRNSHLGWKAISKWILKKQDVTIWSVFIFFGTVTSDELL